MFAARLLFVLAGSLALMWHAVASAQQAYAYFRSRDFTNVARRLLVIMALGCLGGGTFIYLLVGIIGWPHRGR